jgi:large subunit ribosomal protein L13
LAESATPPAKPKPAPPAKSPKAKPSPEKAKPAKRKQPTAPSGSKPDPAAPIPSKPAPVSKAPPPPRTEPHIVIDASGLVLGRAASAIAKRLLGGETVIVVNSEKSVVTGGRAAVLEEFRARRARGSVRSGPHYPRYPDRIFRRAVRGMVPHLKTRGKEAMDRLTVHLGVPPGLSVQSSQSVETARAHPSVTPPLTLEEISRLLGARL